MTATDQRRGWWRAAWRSAVILLLSGCAGLGSPPMEPLTADGLAAAQRRWAAAGTDTYRLVVRVRAPRFAAALYDVVVASGQVVAIAHDGVAMRPEDAAHDYSVPGLFALLREDLRLLDVPHVGDVPPLDLRARFEPESGRLVRYRRTVGSDRRRVLLVEVVDYEPLATPLRVAACCTA